MACKGEPDAIKKESVEIEKILFFTRSGDISQECRELISQLEGILDIKIEKVGISSFYSTLDKYYNKKDSFILFDLNLNEYGCFEEWINVRYANSKKNKGKGKIWFYTTGGRDLKSMLEQNFKGQSIDVEGFYGGQIFWNNSQILQISNGN